jgi:SAM-dependent methyltransferase/uncharacterized protein YbaR (Trm112 family)
MKRTLTELLRCPETGSRLALHVFAEAGGEVTEGVLVAADGRHWYPLTRSIPRLLPPELFPRGDFAAEHRRELEQLGLKAEEALRGSRPSDGASPAKASPATAHEGGGLITMKQRTAESFTFEWREYQRFGWDDPTFDLERERRVFLQKTVSAEADWAGALTLDAGCGNGRYSYWAARFGAKVVAMDLSESVDGAYANTPGLDVHVVQGDILRPPFARETFARVFSIGVLMHTGDARRATLSLCGLLAPGGELSINLYGRGNPVYELNDRLVRRFTARMDRRDILRFTARMARFADFCARHHLLNLVNAFIRLENHPHCIFDWYSAPVATHHSDGEVASWFRAGGLEVVAVESGRPGSLNRAAGRLLGATAFRAGSSVRLLGRKPTVRGAEGEQRVDQ